MNTINPVFNSYDFWKLFIELKNEELTTASLKTQIELLSTDFKIDKEIIKEDDDDQYEMEFTTIFIEFNCGKYFDLSLEYDPLEDGFASKNLFLFDKQNNKKYLMGWWDLARWHPYCLRLEELEILLSYWKKKNVLWGNESLPLLLLAHFIGFDNEEDAISFQERLLNHFKIVLPNIDEALLIGLSEVAYLSDDKYQWKEDVKLGWVFESEENACYSLRNKSHLTGEEGMFPFEKWQELLTQCL